MVHARTATGKTGSIQRGPLVSCANSYAMAYPRSCSLVKTEKCWRSEALVRFCRPNAASCRRPLSAPGQVQAGRSRTAEAERAGVRVLRIPCVTVAPRAAESRAPQRVSAWSSRGRSQGYTSSSCRSQRGNLSGPAHASPSLFCASCLPANAGVHLPRHVDEVAELVALGLQIAPVVRVGRRHDRDAFQHLEAVAFETGALGGVVR